MISKAQFIGKLQNEVRILKHLASKATTPEILNFSFSDKQRTTTQWLAYIAIVGGAVAQEVLQDDGSGFATFNERYENFNTDTFAETIDTDLAKIIAILDSTDDAKFAEDKTMWGRFTDTRAGHIMSINDLYVAYKTQIFLQIKAAGVSDLSTMNLWAGEDMPPATADGKAE